MRTTRKISSYRAEKGVALIELAIILPLLFLCLTVCFNLAVYVFNVGRGIDAVFEGVAYAPHSSTATEVKTKVETLMAEGCVSCSATTANVTFDSPNNRVTVVLDVTYDLFFLPIPGWQSLNFSLTQIGFLP